MLRHIEIVEIQGVLRMIVAPEVTLGTVHTRSLQRTVSISVLLANRQGIRKVVAEEHVNIHQLRIALVLFRHIGKELLPDDPATWVATSSGDGPSSENAFGHSIVWGKPGALTRTWPAIIKDVVWWNHEDIRVNE